MPRKQKVKFHKGDQRPAKDVSLSYIKKMVKKGRKILWQVIEKPSGSIIQQYFFEEDAHKLMRFQNKHKVWKHNGGIPSFLCYKYKNKTS